MWPWGWTAKIITNDASGMVLLSFDTIGNTGVCFLSELTVIPPMRRKGIATALLEKAIEYCRDHGMFRIDLVSVQKDFVIKFYEDHGFEFGEERDGGVFMNKLLYDYGKAK